MEEGAELCELYPGVWVAPGSYASPRCGGRSDFATAHFLAGIDVHAHKRWTSDFLGDGFESG